jgi:hypothetical protein
MGHIPFASAGDALRAAAFFAGRPQAHAPFHRLAAEAATWGPIQVVATKVRVCLFARTRFLYVPVAHASGSIIVRFLTPHPLDSPRLRRDAEGGRWSHRVTLAHLDDEALVWFRAAYEADRDRD